VSPSMKTCPIRCDSVMDASVRAAQVAGAVGAGVGVAGVRVAGAGVCVAGAGTCVAAAVSGEAEGKLGDKLGDTRIAVDVDGAALGGVDATQPPMSEANNATVTRRAAGCRGRDLMFFQTTERPRTFDLRRWIRTGPFRPGAFAWSAASLATAPPIWPWRTASPQGARTDSGPASGDDGHRQRSRGAVHSSYARASVDPGHPRWVDRPVQIDGPCGGSARSTSSRASAAHDPSGVTTQARGGIGHVAAPTG
jgi:hypothetical protein